MKKDKKLEFYVLNWDSNSKKVINQNIFSNTLVKEETLNLIQEYERDLVTFKEFVKQLKQIIMWQEWSRCEYEIAVGDTFEQDPDMFEKWDCYKQFEPNAEMFAEYLVK